MKGTIGMQSASPPIDLPEDLCRDLGVAAGLAGKTPTEIVIEAVDFHPELSRTGA
jgi:hypothetical protein